MTPILPTKANLAFLKQTARSGYPHWRSSHVSEALAYGLGQSTHAALLARIDEVGAVRLALFDRNRFIERLNQLDPLHARPELQWQCPPSSQFPNPIWREIKDGDILGSNNWYFECQRNGIPCISIVRRRKYARFEWDCVSLDPRYDKMINGEHSKTLLDAMFKRFQLLAEPRKAIFEGSVFVGHIDPLNPESAFRIADDFFALLYSSIGLGEPPTHN